MRFWRSRCPSPVEPCTVSAETCGPPAAGLLLVGTVIAGYTGEPDKSVSAERHYDHDLTREAYNDYFKLTVTMQFGALM